MRTHSKIVDEIPAVQSGTARWTMPDSPETAMPRLISTALALFATAALMTAQVQAATVKVLTASAFKQVEVQNNTAGALAKRIAAGETFDVLARVASSRPAELG